MESKSGFKKASSDHGLNLSSAKKWLSLVVIVGDRGKKMKNLESDGFKMNHFLVGVILIMEIVTMVNNRRKI